MRLRLDFLGVKTVLPSASLSSSSMEVPPGVMEVLREERDLCLGRRGRMTLGVGSEREGCQPPVVGFESQYRALKARMEGMIAYLCLNWRRWVYDRSRRPRLGPLCAPCAGRRKRPVEPCWLFSRKFQRNGDLVERLATHCIDSGYLFQMHRYFMKG